MCNNPKQTSGFTLLELIVAISIAGILMALAIPSFSDMIRNNRLTTYTNELVTALNVARSEAVKRGQQVVVRKTGTNWENGWQVFVDVDRPAGNAAKENVFNDDSDATLCETGEDCLLRTYNGLASPYTLRGNNFVNFVRYQPDGTSNTNGSFAVCDNSDGNNLPERYTSKLIIISQVGRIRMARDSNNDGIPDKDNNQPTPTPLSSCITP
jgi:type IV fimbrial biogenesis protein FimT